MFHALLKGAFAMKVEVCCPDCGWTVSVDEAHLGKTGRCKSCNSTFKLELQSSSTGTGVESTGLDSLPTISEPEAEFGSSSSSFKSPQSVATRRNRNQLSRSDLPPKIREILWDNEELIYEPIELEFGNVDDDSFDPYDEDDPDNEPGRMALNIGSGYTAGYYDKFKLKAKVAENVNGKDVIVVVVAKTFEHITNNDITNNFFI